MYILSADTAAKTASVCVSRADGDKVLPLSLATVNSTLTHSESLLPMIDFCLKNAGITFSDIDIAAISAGPGSFTGVRIGVATIKGLTYANPDCKCMGVSSLEALAYNLNGYPKNIIILPVMDARRNQFYNAAFSFTNSEKLKRHCEDMLWEYDKIICYLEENFPKKRIVLTGDGAELFYSLFKKSGSSLNISVCDAAQIYEDAFSVAKCALNLLLSGNKNAVSCSEKLNPIYLRASQAERERNERISGGK